MCDSLFPFPGGGKGWGWVGASPRTPEEGSPRNLWALPKVVTNLKTVVQFLLATQVWFSRDLWCTGTPRPDPPPSSFPLRIPPGLKGSTAQTALTSLHVFRKDITPQYHDPKNAHGGHPWISRFVFVLSSRPMSYV